MNIVLLDTYLFALFGELMMLLTFCILFGINFLIFVAGLALAVFDFRNFHISLHLLLISLLSFVVMFICFLFHKKRRPPSNVDRDVVDDDDLTFFKIFKFFSRRRGENSWQTTIVERSKKENSRRNHCRRCRTIDLGSPDVKKSGDQLRRQILKTKIPGKPAHLSRSLKILTRNYANHERDLSSTTFRRKIANVKSLSSPLRRKSNDLVDVNVAENGSLIISQENGAFETLQELISMHSQASLLSGGSFPLHERFGPGLVSPEGSEERHCSRMETVDLKKFLRSKTCQQIEIDRTVRATAPPLKFITRLTQSSASLNLSEIPTTRSAKASTVSQQYVTETMKKGRRSDRQHRILVKYIPVKNEWIYKSDPDPQSPTFKCDMISLSHFGNKCG